MRVYCNWSYNLRVKGGAFCLAGWSTTRLESTGCMESSCLDWGVTGNHGFHSQGSLVMVLDEGFSSPIAHMKSQCLFSFRVGYSSGPWEKQKRLQFNLLKMIRYFVLIVLLWVQIILLIVYEMENGGLEVGVWPVILSHHMLCESVVFVLSPFLDMAGRLTHCLPWTQGSGIVQLCQMAQHDQSWQPSSVGFQPIEKNHTAWGLTQKKLISYRQFPVRARVSHGCGQRGMGGVKRVNSLVFLLIRTLISFMWNPTLWPNYFTNYLAKYHHIGDHKYGFNTWSLKRHWHSVDGNLDC